MYLDVYWMGPLDPDTGLPSEQGGRYSQLENLNFAPQTDLTGNTLPINEYTVDVITEDEIPTEAVVHELRDERNLLWSAWPIQKVQRLAPNCLRITAKSWLHYLDGRSMAAKMYDGETAADAIAECFGNRINDYTISTAIRNKTVSGYAPEQSARLRLTWLLFVLGAHFYDIYREDVAITAVDGSATQIPVDRTFSGASVDTSDWVTEIRATMYSYTEGEPQSGDDYVTVDGVDYIVATNTFNLTNPNAPGEAMENVIDVRDITLINSGNVGDVLTRLANYWFSPVQASLECINNRKYKPGDLITATYSRDGSMVSGYIQQERFGFGKQARSALNLIGCAIVPTASLIIKCMWDGKRIATERYSLPMGVSYSIENPYIDKTIGKHRYVFRPTTATSEGTMTAKTKTITVNYEIALDLYKGTLHVVSVDSVETQTIGGEAIGVIA